MNSLPVITVRPVVLAPGVAGWGAVCTCGWRLEQINRPVVDIEAAQHRAECSTRRAKRTESQETAK